MTTSDASREEVSCSHEGKDFQSDASGHHGPSSTAVIPVYDRATENRVRLKIDLAIIPLAALIFLFCFIDRSNIGNARLAGLEEDLNFTGYDFNSVNSILYISYIVFEIPSTLLCKIVGPGYWLPFITIMFGLLTVASAYVNNYSQLAACRFLLGLFEAGVMPGLSYYLSRFYRHSELTFRLSLYIVTAPLAGAFGGLLATGILQLPALGHKIPAGSWRAIFLVEGIITVGIGLFTLVFLTDRPDSARFLTAEERECAVNRIKEERIGNSVVLDKISKNKLIKGAVNPVTAASSICFMFCSLSIQGLALFAPTIVRSIYPDVSTTFSFFFLLLFSRRSVSADQIVEAKMRSLKTNNSSENRHPTAAPDCAPLRRGCRLPPHHVLRQLEAQHAPDLHDCLRAAHDDRVPHLPSHQGGPDNRPIRRHVPHGQHVLHHWSPEPLAVQRQRQLRHGQEHGHCHHHVLWQHW